MGQVKTNKRACLIGMITSFSVTIWYPIILFYSMPIDEAIDVMTHEVTWSLFSLFLIPIGFGLMCSVLSFDIFNEIGKTTKIILLISFISVAGLLFMVILEDSVQIPKPDRISATKLKGIDFQEAAIQIDKCLRDNKNCKSSQSELNSIFTEIVNIKDVEDIDGLRKLKNLNIVKCLDEDKDNVVSKFILRDISNHPKGSKNNKFSTYKKKIVYACALSKLLNNKEPIPSSAMKYIAIILNFVLLLYILLFIYITGLYYVYGQVKVGKSTVHILLGSLVILLTWFPLRIYSVWYEWYGSFYYMKHYPIFLILLIISILLLSVYLAWCMRINLNVNAFVAIPAVNSVIAIVATILVWLKPDTLIWFFESFSEASNTLIGLFFFIILFFTGIYTASLIEQK